MPELDFDNLNRLNLLWVVLAVAVVGVYGVWQRRRALRMFATPNLLPRLAPPIGWTRPLARLALVTLALTALVAALLGPRWGERQVKFTQRGIDVLVLLDVSKSMLARDIAPNRLERAKISIRDDLTPALGGDRIGLITFAGAPSLKCPLTHDYGFFRLALDDVTTESSPRGGTLIGDAIRKAADAHDKKLGNQRVVLLITDGEDQQSYPLEAAQDLWAKRQVPIVTVALGDERQGARIPIEGDRRGAAYMTHDGQIVWSKANFDILRRIAEVSELNAFIPVGTRNFNLGDIYREVIVPAVHFQQHEGQEIAEMPARFHAFAVAALLLTLIDSLLRDGPRGPASAAPARRGVERAA